MNGTSVQMRSNGTFGSLLPVEKAPVRDTGPSAAPGIERSDQAQSRSDASGKTDRAAEARDAASDAARVRSDHAARASAERRAADDKVFGDKIHTDKEAAAARETARATSARNADAADSAAARGREAVAAAVDAAVKAGKATASNPGSQAATQSEAPDGVPTVAANSNSVDGDGPDVPVASPAESDGSSDEAADVDLSTVPFIGVAPVADAAPADGTDVSADPDATVDGEGTPGDPVVTTLGDVLAGMQGEAPDTDGSVVEAPGDEVIASPGAENGAEGDATVSTGEEQAVVDSAAPATEAKSDDTPVPAVPDSVLADLIARLQAMLGNSSADAETGADAGADATGEVDLAGASRKDLLATLDSLIGRAKEAGRSLTPEERATLGEAIAARQAANGQPVAASEEGQPMASPATAGVPAGASGLTADGSVAEAASRVNPVAADSAKRADAAVSAARQPADASGDDTAEVDSDAAPVKTRAEAASDRGNGVAEKRAAAQTTETSASTSTNGNAVNGEARPADGARKSEAAEPAKTVNVTDAPKAATSADLAAASNREPSKVAAEAARDNPAATKPGAGEAGAEAADGTKKAATSGKEAAGKEAAAKAAELTNIAVAKDAQPTPPLSGSASDGLIVLQSDTRAGHPSALPSQHTTVTLARGTALAAGVAAEIARFAGKGDSRFEIRLDPPELGRVDVRLKVADDGTVKAHLFVERSETLDNFLRDQRSLERTLEQAGLKTDSGSLQFSLRSGNGGSEFGQQGDESRSWAGAGSSADIPEMTEMERISAVFTNSATGRLDIRV